jgi:branched-chain amino acid transport system permease protein
MGVRVKRVFALSWAIAALLCPKRCGAEHDQRSHTDSLSTAGLKIFPVIVLGGLNSIGGAIVGGIVIGLLETFTGGYILPILSGSHALYGTRSYPYSQTFGILGTKRTRKGMIPCNP